MASGGATPDEIQVVVAQPAPPVGVPVVQASLVRSISVKSIAAARPVIRSTGAEGKAGVPFIHCECGEEVHDAIDLCMKCFCGAGVYLLIACVIIFGAGGIARLTATTELYGAALGFVSWLLCMLLFIGCAALWCCIVQVGSGDDDPAVGCASGWVSLGCVASVLCIVLSHIGDKIDYMEAQGPAATSIIPEPPATGQRSVLNNDYLLQDRVREVSFAPGSYLDLSLATAVIQDVAKSW